MTPRSMRAAFAQFLAFVTDVADNQASLGTTLPMPVLALGGAQSFGATQAVVRRHVATQVTEVVIPHAGHGLMEEQPTATITAIRTFPDAKNVKVEP
jgi:pimeloyl-ACP methyl ester carboxylesterase